MQELRPIVGPDRRFTRSDFIGAHAEQLETSAERPELAASRVFEELRHYLPQRRVA